MLQQHYSQLYRYQVLQQPGVIRFNLPHCSFTWKRGTKADYFLLPMSSNVVAGVYNFVMLWHKHLPLVAKIHPEMTLCGWQDIRIHSLANHYAGNTQKQCPEKMELKLCLHLPSFQADLFNGVQFFQLSLLALNNSSLGSIGSWRTQRCSTTGTML